MSESSTPTRGSEQAQAPVLLPERAFQPAPERLDHRRISAQRRVFEALVDPANDGLSETEKARLAHMAPRTWRKWRTVEVVNAALAARRATYVQHLAEIDAALLKKAKEGSLPHALVVYERVESWVPGLTLERKDSNQIDRELWALLTPQDQQTITDVIGRAWRGRHLLPAAGASERGY